MKSTIKDVAKAAGVSVATVSYVLNGTKRVSPEVEKRVFEAANTLQYQAHASARNLRRSENCIIGYELPVPDPKDFSTLMLEFAHGLTLTLSEVGYNLITFAAVHNEDPLTAYRRLINTNRVDGFVISHTNWEDTRIEFLLEVDFPFVAFGRSQRAEDFAYVDVDGGDGIYQATQHLIVNNHREFAFVGWAEGSFSGDNRFWGYETALHEAGLQNRADYVRRCKNRVEDGYMAAAFLMQQNPAPTAIVCVSDAIAIGVLQYLTNHHYPVGKEIAVTGFDNIAVGNFTTPSLTSVAQPIETVKNSLIDILLGDLQDQPLENRQQLLRPTLLVRGSSDFIL